VRSQVLCGFLRIPLELHERSVPCPPQLRTETGEAKPNARMREGEQPHCRSSPEASETNTCHATRAVNEFITARRVPTELDLTPGPRGAAWSLLTFLLSTVRDVAVSACRQTLTRNAVIARN